MTDQQSITLQSKQHTVEVHVKYGAATHPFHAHLIPSITVSELKTQALHAFHLVEGAAVHGGTVTYDLIHNRHKLTELNQTLGHLVGTHHEITMTLAQVLTQG